ncbi:DUF55-domain-containing protein [Thozetella sp. PMI_491]|nr:DUF55-domain-containing protein [Thozetella sp. PMI_491]
MPKRKSTHQLEPEAELEGTRRRSLRARPSDATADPKPAKSAASTPAPKTTKKAPAATAKKSKKLAAKKSAESVDDEQPPAKKSRGTKEPEADQKAEAKPAANGSASAASGERQYWLMKAEPETRLENGVDVRFSIDDLAARTKPEPWDGIRAYAARNNLRAMKKGDLAFFYHSNCKEPGIVGTMEIVQEHSPDLSAHDPKAPYYDPKSKPDDPKWSVVHVKFRSKFAKKIGLQELKAMGAAGKPLENMQMLKQSRLSVSKVGASEWEYLNKVAEEKAKES